MILVLRALGIGDLATAVPALRGLRTAFPGEPVTLAAPAWLAPLVGLTGAVDHLDPTDGLDPRPWQGPPPRLAVNLHGRGPESHRLLARAHPGELWAFGTGPAWRDDEHEVHRWCRLLSWYGVRGDPADLDLAGPPTSRPGVTVVHPGAKAPLRRWPPDRFAEVARTLLKDGHEVVVTGSRAEAGLAARVAADAGLPPGAVLTGLDLGELAGLVAGARLLVSGDTGIAHLATAFGTPSVILFGPMSPDRWGPPADRPRHVALWHGRASEPGDGPGEEPHPAMLAVTVEEVSAAACAVSGTYRPSGR